MYINKLFISADILSLMNEKFNSFSIKWNLKLIHIKEILEMSMKSVMETIYIMYPNLILYKDYLIIY